MSSRKNPVRTKRRAHVQQYSTGQAPANAALSPVVAPGGPSAIDSPRLGDQALFAGQNSPQTAPGARADNFAPLQPLSGSGAPAIGGHLTGGPIGGPSSSGPRGASSEQPLAHATNTSHKPAARSTPAKKASGPGIRRKTTAPTQVKQPDWDDNWGETGDWAAEEDAHIDAQTDAPAPAEVPVPSESHWEQDQWGSEKWDPEANWKDQDDWQEEEEQWNQQDPQQHAHLEEEKHANAPYSQGQPTSQHQYPADSETHDEFHNHGENQQLPENPQHAEHHANPYAQDSAPSSYDPFSQSQNFDQYPEDPTQHEVNYSTEYHHHQHNVESAFGDEPRHQDEHQQHPREPQHSEFSEKADLLDEGNTDLSQNEQQYHDEQQLQDDQHQDNQYYQEDEQLFEKEEHQFQDNPLQFDEESPYGNQSDNVHDVHGFEKEQQRTESHAFDDEPAQVDDFEHEQWNRESQNWEQESQPWNSEAQAWNHEHQQHDYDEPQVYGPETVDVDTQNQEHDTDHHDIAQPQHQEQELQDQEFDQEASHEEQTNQQEHQELHHGYESDEQFGHESTNEVHEAEFSWNKVHYEHQDHGEQLTLNQPKARGASSEKQLAPWEHADEYAHSETNAQIEEKHAHTDDTQAVQGEQIDTIDDTYHVEEQNLPWDQNEGELDWQEEPRASTWEESEAHQDAPADEEVALEESEYQSSWAVQGADDLVIVHKNNARELEVQELQHDEDVHQASGDAHAQSSEEANGQERNTILELKLAALEMLSLDDDLLLDDDFLEDDTDLLGSDYQGEDEAYEQRIDEWNQQANMHQVIPPQINHPQPSYPSPGANVVETQARGQPAQQPQHLQPQGSAPDYGSQAQKPKPRMSSIAAKYSKATELPVKHNAQTPQHPSPFVQPPGANVIPVAKKADEEMKKRLDAAKKKNDAYDFPMAMQATVKPASRVPSKPVVPTLPIAPQVQGAVSGSEPPAAPPLSSRTSGSDSAASHSKSFFEELPESTVKRGLRPGRAAAVATAPVNQPIQQAPPTPSQVPAVKKKSPKNPYAQLAPKAVEASVFNKPQMGSVPVNPPVGQAPMGNIPMAPPGTNNQGGVPNKYQPSTLPPIGSSHPPTAGLIPPPGISQPSAKLPSFGVVPPPGPLAPPNPGSPLINYNQRGPVDQANAFPPQGFQNQFQGQPGQPGPQGPQGPHGPIGFQGQQAPQAFQGNYQPPQAPGITSPSAGFVQPANFQQSQPQWPSQPGHVQSQQPAPFPSVKPQAQNDTSIRVHTNLGKSTEKNSALSPYIPHSGPYAPSAANRGHSRTNSIIGGRGKEVNPYAPAQPSAGGAGPNVHPQGVIPMGAASAHTMKLPVARNRGRSFGKQNGPRSGRLSNPAALLQRQFPIFHWGPSQNVACLIPQVQMGFGPAQKSIKVVQLTQLVPDLEIYCEFPGPLTKLKSKKKEVESWLEKVILKLQGNYSDEVFLAQVLLALVKHDGQFSSPALHKDLSAILTPNIDFSEEQSIAPTYMNQGGLGLASNAYKLDTAGLNTVWSLLQTGNREKALEYAISKQDWALSFVIAQSISPERFSKVASDYTRMTFPFQKTQNSKVQHLMPILMKSFVGNAKGAIEDFLNVPSEAEFAKSHYREIISAAIINNTSHEFLVEYGKFLADANMALASELCYMIAGVVLSKNAMPNGAVFSLVGSFLVTSVYNEVYEYILTISPATGNNIPPSGLPLLLQSKIEIALFLADLGAIGSSRRYCDHVSAILKTLGRSPFVSPQALTDFQNLVVRISNSNATDSGWLGSKLSKVNLDKVWGHLDKFIGGEVPTPKSDNGVFSKFSPSISRNTSALDVSQIPTSSPVGRPEISQHASFMTGPPSEFPSPSQSSNRVTGSLRYAPGGGNVNPAQKMSALPQGASQPVPFAPNSLNGHARQPQGQTSQSGLQEDIRSKYPHTKRLSSSAGSSKNQPYGNRNAHLSNLSLASQSSVQQPPSFTATPISGQYRPAIGSADQQRYKGNGELYGHSRSNSKGHSRISSLSSEFSQISDKESDKHYERVPEPIQELLESNTSVPQIARKSSPVGEDLNAVEDRESSGDGVKELQKETTEDTFETENHGYSKEPQADQEAIVTENSKDEDAGKAISDPTHPENEHAPKEDLNHEETEQVEPEKVSENSATSEAAAPPPQTSSSKNAAPPKRNPYAPGASKSVSKGSNKYGPRGGASANRYSGAGGQSNLMGASDSAQIDMFGYQPQQVEPKKVEESPKAPENSQSQEVEMKLPEQADTEKIKEEAAVTEGAPETLKDAEVTKPMEAPKSGPPPRLGPPPRRSNPYAPSQKLSEANVDISFDADQGDESAVNTPSARKPIALVLNNSPGAPAKERFLNPFLEENEQKGELNIRNGLDEFPIPGSPEYTTRANSVIGHHGLYSSRLSQSHQTDMYQQYEVKDDTVLDYIPVEEDEEDEEEKAQAKLQEERRKLEQEKKRKEDEQQLQLVSRSGQESRGSQQSGGSGNKWFLGLLKLLNDDKPKPIKAKLGQKNTFKYDEKLQRWIDTSRPLEEQLQAAAPPPPPKKKILSQPDGGKKPIAMPSSSNAEEKAAPPVPPQVGESKEPPKPSGPARKAAKPRPSGAADIANSGLDDLLSLTGSNMVGGPRKGKRRYVNVMDKK